MGKTVTMSGNRPPDGPEPAQPEADSVWDFSEDARPGLKHDDGAVEPEQIAPDVIAPDLEKNNSEPDFGSI